MSYAPSLVISFGFDRLKANAMTSIGAWILLVTNLTWGFVSDRIGARGPMVTLGLLLLQGVTLGNRLLITSTNGNLRFAFITLSIAFSANWRMFPSPSNPNPLYSPPPFFQGTVNTLLTPPPQTPPTAPGWPSMPPRPASAPSPWRCSSGGGQYVGHRGLSALPAGRPAAVPHGVERHRGARVGRAGRVGRAANAQYYFLNRRRRGSAATGEEETEERRYKP